VIATLDNVESSESAMHAQVRVTAAGSMVFGANYPSGSKLFAIDNRVGSR